MSKPQFTVAKTQDIPKGTIFLLHTNHVGTELCVLANEITVTGDEKQVVSIEIPSDGSGRIAIPETRINTSGVVLPDTEIITDPTSIVSTPQTGHDPVSIYVSGSEIFLPLRDYMRGMISGYVNMTTGDILRAPLQEPWVGFGSWRIERPGEPRSVLFSTTTA